MASIRNSARIRSAVLCIVAAASAAFALPGRATAAPADPPTPTIASVTAQLDALGRQTELLAEKYNKAQIDVASARTAAAAAEASATSAEAQYQVARTQLVALAAAAYEGGSFSRTGALLTSNSGEGYLDTLDTLDLMSSHEAGVVRDLTRARIAASAARRHADALVIDTESKRQAVAEQRAKAAAETDRFQTLLRTLTAAQQAAYRAREAATQRQVAATMKPRTGTPGPFVVGHGSRASNPGAQRAVDFALAQVGKPYVFGAAGPDAYDCSGLTMAAWAAGGVSLPHLAASQYGYGTHVSANELQPGDLVFLYQPIGHVSIYVGNGMVVSAPQPGESVKIMPFAYELPDFVGATRP